MNKIDIWFLHLRARFSWAFNIKPLGRYSKWHFSLDKGSTYTEWFRDYCPYCNTLFTVEVTDRKNIKCLKCDKNIYGEY